jgi:hypothetical protein
MNRTILALFVVSLIGFSACQSIKREILEAFESKPTKEVFKAWHFAYDLNSQEGLNRYRIFKENIKMIKQVNSEKRGYTLGIGPFTDLTSEEFVGTNVQRDEDKLKGIEELNDVTEGHYFKDDIDPTWLDNLPDWTYLVKEVPKGRERKYFGICHLETTYLMTVTMYELHMGLNNLPQKKLSRQNFFDCTDFSLGERCSYLTTPLLLNGYYLSKGGLYTAENYPMLKTEFDIQSCKFKPYDYTSQVYGCNALASSCTLDAKVELLKKGPALTNIENLKDFQHYKDGIFDSKTCNDAQKASTFGIVLAIKKDYVAVLLGFGKDFANNGIIKLSREFSERIVLEKYKRTMHSCGAETDLIVPFNFKYIGA